MFRSEEKPVWPEHSTLVGAVLGVSGGGGPVPCSGQAWAGQGPRGK